MKIIGAFAGLIVGSIIDFFQNESKEYPKTTRTRQTQGQTRSNRDFTGMLLMLSAHIMRADGQVLKSELNYVKAFFQRNLGDQFQVRHLQELKYYLNRPGFSLSTVCADLRSITQLEDRILILHYLFGIAAADGSISQSELKEIFTISNLLNVPKVDFMRIQNMFVRSADSDYKVLGLGETATVEEIKKKYRELALRFHPDRVAHLGEEHQQNAKEQFQQLQEAYENIKKERGF